LLNNLAWNLVLRDNRPSRDYEEALLHARKCVELGPPENDEFNTLALAEYRVRHWNESIAAAKKSVAISTGGSAGDWFLLAMAHAQKGEKEEARKWYDKAIVWTNEKDPKNAELRQLRKEAAQLLAIPGPH
jgi:tetratricopeptide (TPR) repeat protein